MLPSSPLVKICGLSTPDTLAAALEARADMVGLVFFPRSPRNVSVRDATRLAEQARGRALIVALTVDMDDIDLAPVVEHVRPDWLQLHGRETPERVAAVKRRFGLPVMKAIGITSRADLALAEPFAGVADRILFDAKPPTRAALPGGNGLSFDWTLLREYESRFVLSGGLTPGNVGEAMRISGARAVDVSSGVETAPGVKDPVLVRAFIDAARA